MAVSLPMELRAQEPPPLLARPAEAAVQLTDEQSKKVKISTPTPDYPLEARKKHLTGRGIYRLNVAERTGEVLSVEVLTSAGYPILDRSAIRTLKTWKFHAHTVSAVKVPITFSMDSSGSNNGQRNRKTGDGVQKTVR